MCCIVQTPSPLSTNAHSVAESGTYQAPKRTAADAGLAPIEPTERLVRLIAPVVGPAKNAAPPPGSSCTRALDSCHGEAGAIGWADTTPWTFVVPCGSTGTGFAAVLSTVTDWASPVACAMSMRKTVAPR